MVNSKIYKRMEFPSIGKSCFWHLCKTLDFLPFTCAYCNQIFCKDHYNQDTHKCEVFKRHSTQKADILSFVCSTEGCTTYSLVEMCCPKCQKHFCLVHRYHNCFDVVEDQEEKKRLWNQPKEQFDASIKTVQSTINEKIKKAVQNPKKQATAMKIQLMRLKGKAEGASSVPTTDRIFFLILLPKGSDKLSKAVFVSQDWSVGRVIDAVSNLCNVINKNNEMNSPKLRLFKTTDGTQISSATSTKIIDLINENRIVNGETLILEYVNPSEDIANFVLSNFSLYNES